MLFVQVCFVCSVLFAAWSMSALLTKTGECREVEEEEVEGGREQLLLLLLGDAPGHMKHGAQKSAVKSRSHTR